MPGIVCAIRVGPNSESTIDKAVELAEETNEQLHFLFVINLEFLTQTMSSRVHTLSEQMRQMGEFILLNAQARADVKLIPSEILIRRGNVTDSIVKLCKDLDAHYVVVGFP